MLSVHWGVIAAFSGIVMFLLGQAGALIWLLSKISERLRQIGQALESGELKFRDHGDEIDDLTARCTTIEAKVLDRNAMACVEHGCKLDELDRCTGQLKKRVEELERGTKHARAITG